MKNILLGALIAASISVSAVTKQPDGSVILTKDEAESLAHSIESMVDAGRRQQQKIQMLEKKLESLEKGKCI